MLINKMHKHQDQTTKTKLQTNIYKVEIIMYVLRALRNQTMESFKVFLYSAVSNNKIFRKCNL